jgi:hypothetical protein
MAEDPERSYFDKVLTETDSLFALWYQWEALFDRPQAQLDRIGHAGNLLFGSIERVFYRDVVLGICRLTDPEHQGKNKNISINHFCSGSYKNDGHLQELINNVKSKTFDVRAWRNKRISHIDSGTGIGWCPPPGCNRQDVSDALQEIFAVLRYISCTYHGSDLLPESLRPQIKGSIERTLSYILPKNGI